MITKYQYLFNSITSNFTPILFKACFALKQYGQYVLENTNTGDFDINLVTVSIIFKELSELL